MNKGNNTRKICITQLKMGKRILRTKTRKAAIKLLEKVPHMKPGDYEKGLWWWDYIQTVPKNSRAEVIETSSKPMMEACLRKSPDGI